MCSISEKRKCGQVLQLRHQRLHQINCSTKAINFYFLPNKKSFNNFSTKRDLFPFDSLKINELPPAEVYNIEQNIMKEYKKYTE